MRALVTGAAGFLGSYLCDRLIADGHEVFAVDKVFDPKNVQHLIGHPRFKYQPQNLRTQSLFAPPGGADAVFHLAALVGVQTAAQKGVDLLTENQEITHNVIEGVRRFMPQAKLVAASSSEVYGDNKEQPLHEDMTLMLPPPTNPRWSYTYEKSALEMVVLGHAAKGRIRGAVARFFNAVGARQNNAYGAVLPSFIHGALKGRIEVHGDGLQTRSFLHAKDTATGLLAVAEHADVGSITNIGGDTELTMLELAQKVRALVNPAAEIHRVEVDGAISGCRRRCADVTKLRALGWRPQFTLDDAIRDLTAAVR